jgi:hypothetical protein
MRLLDLRVDAQLDQKDNPFLLVYPWCFAGLAEVAVDALAWGY